MKFKQFFLEAFDQPYSYKFSFKTHEIETDEDEDGYKGMKEVFDPVQIIYFTGKDNTQYIWYARQNRYDDTCWEIAFGVHDGKNVFGGESLNLDFTNKNDASRIFATVLSIINAFIDYDENCEIRRLFFTSKGDKRTKFYLKHIVPKIEKFELDSHHNNGTEDEITLIRTSH